MVYHLSGSVIEVVNHKTISSVSGGQGGGDGAASSSRTTTAVEDAHSEVSAITYEIDAAAAAKNNNNNNNIHGRQKRRRRRSSKSLIRSIQALETAVLVGRDIEQQVLQNTWFQAIAAPGYSSSSSSAMNYDDSNNNNILHQEDDDDEENDTDNDEQEADNNEVIVLHSEEEPSSASSARINNNNPTKHNKQHRSSNIQQRQNKKKKNKKTVIHIHGESGVGKSRLVEASLRKCVVVESQGIFVSGKFDQLSSRRFPFHAIIDAFGDLFDMVVSLHNHNHNAMAQVAASIESELNPFDWDQFVQFVSVPSQLTSLVHRSNNNTKSQGKNNNKDDSINGAARDSSSTTAATATAASAEVSVEPFKRLKRACQLVLQCISKIQPILFFLDDVQWANSECISMIQSLQSTAIQSASQDDDDERRRRRRIVMVMAFRDGHQMSDILTRRDNSGGNNNNNNNNSASAAPTTEDESNFILDLPLRNLGQSDVELFLSHLSFSDDESIQLGKIVFEKTQGNPFFVIQLLELMKIHGFISVSPRLGTRLECNDMKGVVRLDVSEGVLSSVDARLYQLSPKARTILIMAAHLGFEFRRNVLAELFATRTSTTNATNTDDDDNPTHPSITHHHTTTTTNHSITSENQESATSSVLDQILQEAETERLIVKGRDNNTYYFMHDRVHEGFYEMVPSIGVKERMFLNIGRKLKRILHNNNNNNNNNDDHDADTPDDPHHQDEDYAYILFITVDCMNNGRSQIVDSEEKFELIDLNVEASERASAACSFALASSYLEAAVDLLPVSSAWTEHYELTLNLHERFAQMLCNCQQLQEAHGVLDTIEVHVRSVSEKQTASHIRFATFQLQGLNRAAISTALGALRALGVVIPENPSFSQVLWKMVQVKVILLGKKTPEDLLNLPPMTDKRIIAIIPWMKKLVLQAVLMGNQALMVYCLASVFRLSVKYGRTTSTPSATALVGMLFKSVDKACQMGNLAIQMLDKFDAECDSCLTQLIAQLNLLTWREPLRTSVPILQHGFELGLRYGDTHHAIISLGAAVSFLLHVGTPLLQTNTEMAACIERISGFAGSNSVLLVTHCYWQAVQNHLGWSDDPLVLSGNVMQEEDILRNPYEEEQGVASTTFLFHKFLLACHYRSLETAFVTLEESKKSAGSFGFVPNRITMEFFACLTYLDVARAMPQKRRRCIIKAQRSYRMLERLSAVHPHSYGAALFGILEAEMHFAKTQTVDQGLYDRAIRKTLEEGFLNYAAIGCERAGLALLDETGNHNNDNATMDSTIYSYLTEGYKINQQWEAFGKVEWYKERYFMEWGESVRFPVPPSVMVDSSSSSSSSSSQDHDEEESTHQQSILS